MTIEELAPAWGNYLEKLAADEQIGPEWTDRDEEIVRAAELEAERSPEMVINVALHAGQIVALLAREQHIFVIAGTGGGKTIFAPRWLYQEIERHQHEPVESQNYLVFAPSYKVLKRATLPAYVRFFHALKLGVFKRGDLVYELRNGGKVYFGSCDNPESLEGLHVRAAHGDEIGQNSVSLEVWETVRRRLAFFGGRFLGTTTPYNLGWLKQHVVDPVRRGVAVGIRVIGFPSIANPMYPRDEFESMRASLPRWKFRMFGLGLFERPEGLIYDVFDEQRHVVDPFEVPVQWVRMAGQDFGLKHPNATIFGAIDPWPFPDDVLYLYAEYRRSERSTPDHIGDIKLLAATASREPIALRKMWCDPRSVQLIADYKAAGLPAEKGDAGPGEVKAGIQEVYTRLATNASDGLPRLRIFRGRCPGWQDEVERYEWAKDPSGNASDRPVEYADDLMDGTRYLCMGLKRPKVADLPTSRPQRDEARPVTAGILGRTF
jgi:hypothetical protein